MAVFYDYSKSTTVDTDADAISNAIRNILLTPRGTMPGKPTFGSDLYKVPFEFIDHITSNLIKNFIINALLEFEPRIRIIEVIVTDIPEYNRVLADILYEYKLDGITVEASTSITLKD